MPHSDYLNGPEIKAVRGEVLHVLGVRWREGEGDGGKELGRQSIRHRA